MPLNHSDKNTGLMLRIKEGDKFAFEELYHLYKIPLANFFYYLTGSEAFTEDCLQEVFYRLWYYRKSYRPQAKVLTYLFQIAKNYWFNEVKCLKRRPVNLTTLTGGGYQSDNEPSTAAEFPSTGSVNPEKAALNEELGQKIREAILSLPDKERIVLVLGKLEGLRYSEIGKALGIAVVTVKVRMNKATNRLREYLKDVI